MTPWSAGRTRDGTPDSREAPVSLGTIADGVRQLPGHAGQTARMYYNLAKHGLQQGFSL